MLPNKTDLSVVSYLCLLLPHIYVLPIKYQSSKLLVSCNGYTQFALRLLLTFARSSSWNKKGNADVLHSLGLQKYIT